MPSLGAYHSSSANSYLSPAQAQPQAPPQHSVDTRRRTYHPTMPTISSHASNASLDTDGASQNSTAYTVGLNDDDHDAARHHDYASRRHAAAPLASPGPPRSASLAYAQQHQPHTEQSPPGTPDSQDLASLTNSGDTASVSLHTLPALQARGLPDVNDRLEPVSEDDPQNFDLVDPPDAPGEPMSYSLEQRSRDIFSAEHLQRIFKEPKLLLKFTMFLHEHRPDAVPNLLYYLDVTKALKALGYANSITRALLPLDGLEYTSPRAEDIRCDALERTARAAFQRMVDHDLPALVTWTWTETVSASISKRITGTLPVHLREASEGLAEVFCLTDPSREDNPIVFASEEFHRTTQYGMSHVIGRNCRFLQGPATSPHSVQRFREAVKAGKETVEVFLNYRRDGSPFMNLLMIAPLRDSKGQLRYFVGAQVDVSGLAKECTDLQGLQAMLADRATGAQDEDKSEFQQLSEMLNTAELDTVRRSGGTMHRQSLGDEDEDGNGVAWQRPRLLLKDPSPMDGAPDRNLDLAGRNLHGKLAGIYSQYFLVRPYPSLRILFTSPSLRVPGILQSPFMNRIASSERVREELVSALAEGRGVTAKVRWVTKHDDEGRPRWIHCTPLLGHNGQVGVWMIVLIDEESSTPRNRHFKMAPPVSPSIRGDYSPGSLRRPSRSEYLAEYDSYPSERKNSVLGRDPRLASPIPSPRGAALAMRRDGGRE